MVYVVLGGVMMNSRRFRRMPVTSLVMMGCRLIAGLKAKFEESWPPDQLFPSFAWSLSAAAGVVAMVPLQPPCSRYQFPTWELGLRLVVEELSRGDLRHFRSFWTWPCWLWTLSTWGALCLWFIYFEGHLLLIIIECLRGLGGSSRRVPLPRGFPTWAVAGKVFNLVQESMSLWMPWQRLVQSQAPLTVVHAVLVRFPLTMRLLRTCDLTVTLSRQDFGWLAGASGIVRITWATTCG